MRTVHCPLCGLRYAHASELDVHVREEHAPVPPPEGRDTVQRHRRAARSGGSREVLRLPW